MSKNLRKKYFTTGVLTLTLAAGAVLTPISVSANVHNSEEQLTQNTIEDVRVIYEDGNTFEYTYNEGGESFKVISSFNSNKTVIDNEVYKVLENGEYELVRETNLQVGEQSATLSTTENGKTKKVQAGEEYLSNTSNKSKTNIRPTIETNDISINSYQDLGPWTYSFTQSYREDIQGATADAIMATMIGIYSWPAGAAATFGTIARSANSNAFWIEDRVSYKYIAGTKLPRGERNEQRTYADQQKQHFLYGPQIIDTYTTGWAP